MATISDVAKRAGVSPVTVSRVINDLGNVSLATRERVGLAIQELGYVPSGVAQSLRSKRTRSLALIVPDIQNSFWTTVARGVEDAAQSKGYSVFLCNTDENPAKQRRYLDVVIGQRVDGVIIAPYDSDATNIAPLRDREIATVVIDRHIEGWDTDTVNSDSIAGARALTQHLLGLGHQRIGIITGPATTTTAADRVRGYRLALNEAGLTPDERLIKYGEFRSAVGERLTHEVLDAGLAPTAIFAANNVIAIGVIAALEKRGLRVPHDIALVCFDDLPNTSLLFPFFTVAAQPVYEVGVNAVQLLFSRLEAEAPLRPRHVVLPTRLVIRHSCGSKWQRGIDFGISLPLPATGQDETRLVPPLGPAALRLAAMGWAGAAAGETRPTSYDNSDIDRLLKALRHQEPDRIPHLEFWVSSRPVLEYVLERPLENPCPDEKTGEPLIQPEEHIEFAQRLGMDAVTCRFIWRPNNVYRQASDGSRHYVDGTVKTWADLENLEPPPSLLDQLNHLERYLRASQGTGVGVAPDFSSFFDSALLAVGMQDALYRFHDDRAFLEHLMDTLLAHQERVVQAVCDRFGDDLAFVLINDDVAHNAGLLIHPDMFAQIFPHRLRRLITPAKERGKAVVFHSDGRLDRLLPLLHSAGVDAVHPVEPEANDIRALKHEWQGKLAFIGNIPTLLLAHGNAASIEERVRVQCEQLGPGGGYVLGSSTSIMEGIPPRNFVAMTQAAHKYGRYGSLGSLAWQFDPAVSGNGRMTAGTTKEMTR